MVRPKDAGKGHFAFHCRRHLPERRGNPLPVSRVLYATRNPHPRHRAANHEAVHLGRPNKPDLSDGAVQSGASLG
jgi:hypothetical protein